MRCALRIDSPYVIPTVAVLLITLLDGIKSFTDLCPDCQRRQDSLVVKPEQPRRQQNGHQIRIGFLFCNTTETMRSAFGFERSAPAVRVALQRAKAEGLLRHIENISVVWYTDNCDEVDAALQTSRLIEADTVDVVIGPSCTKSAFFAALVAAFYDTPIILWGAGGSWSALQDRSRFRTVTSVNTNYYTLSIGVRMLLLQYNWSEFALIFSYTDDEPKCDYFQQDFTKAVGEIPEVKMVYKQRIVIAGNKGNVRKALEHVQTLTRIIVICISSDAEKRKFMLDVKEMGLADDDDFVLILPDLTGLGMKQLTFRDPNDFEEHKRPFIWESVDESDGYAESIKAVVRRSIFIDMNHSALWSENDTFTREFQESVGQFPFNICEPNECGRLMPSLFARSLYDATYLYVKCVDRVVRGGGTATDFRNGTLFTRVAEAMEFVDSTGRRLRLNENGTLEATFYVSALDEQDVPTMYLSIDVRGVTTVVKELYADENSSIWATRHFRRPMTRPSCGLFGELCRSDSVFLVFGGGLLALCVIVTLSMFINYARRRALNMRRNVDNWMIPYKMLFELSHAPNADGFKSSASVQRSRISVQSQTTERSGERPAALMENNNARENHAFFIYGQEVIYAKKYVTRVQLSRDEMNRLEKLKHFENDNVNRFYGISMDGPMMFSIWKYCQRGSLWDLIKREAYVDDSFVMFALLRDIIDGLIAIHNSIGPHGALTSKCCLVNDRWQVKLSDYGMDAIRCHQWHPNKSYLWTAPEILRCDDFRGTKEGDIYSFGIIGSELWNRKAVWNNVNSEERIDAIITRVKAGKTPYHRPRMCAREGIDPKLVDLICECWDENPSARPKMSTVRTKTKQMIRNSEQSLLDYVFGILENYANSLQQEVAERTKELDAEREKSVQLLYRMLPRQVADRLRVGEPLMPEIYDMSTIFFSDVVSFTVLAGRCTPLQVVTLLNQLYTIFDSLIEKRDAYKIETIGDAYLICSGIPTRNGDRHASEIAELSMDIIAAVRDVRIPHLPDERINVRIGFHSGPAVAGVVGLTMPRYCIFGESVNIAHLLESCGIPGRIHISSSANHILTQVIGDYLTERRGETPMKGQGMMETFFVVGHTRHSEASE